jgi:hypothetical protein
MIPPNEFRNAENFRFRGGSVVSRGVLLRLPPETCHRTMRTLSVLHEAAKVIIILSALLGAASLVMGDTIDEGGVPGRRPVTTPEPGRGKAPGINLWPGLIYGAGAGADIWSTRTPPAGFHYVDHSFAGPIVGPVLTGAAFATADGLLQKTHHKGWAWTVRGLYAVGDAIVVISNKRKR